MQSARKNIFLKTLRIAGWLILSVVLLLAAVVLLIQIPAVQLKVTQKAVSFLEDKIGTKVSLDGIYIGFPKNIVLQGIYLEDQQGDTLLYAGKLSIDTDLWALMQHEIQLNNVSLEHSAAFITRAPHDSAFNFSYIVDAFAGDSTAVPDTLEQKGWNISLKKLQVEGLRMNYDDRLTDNALYFSLGSFQVAMNEFDLENSIYRAGEIDLKDTRAIIRQTQPPAKTADTKPPDSTAALLLSLEKLNLENIAIDYKQTALSQALVIRLGGAAVEADNIDLPHQQLALQSVRLAHMDLSYTDKESAEAPIEKTDPPPGSGGSAPWTISVATLIFEESSFRFDQGNKPRAEHAVDFDHLSLSHFNFTADDILYSDEVIKADLKNLSFAEHSGFALRSLRANVNIRQRDASLQDFLLETDNSRLEARASATFTSLDNIAAAYPDASLSVNIHQSVIGIRDLLYFEPSLADSLPVNLSRTSEAYIDAVADGTVGNLNIHHLDFRALSDTYLKTSGTVSGLPNAKNLRLDIALDQLHTSRRDVGFLLPDTLLPDSIQLPAWVDIKGNYRGTTEKAAFNVRVTSSAGNLSMNGNLNLDSASVLRGVTAFVNVNELDIGGILGKPDSVMGSLSMHADLQTTGLTMEEMSGSLTGSIDRFDFNRYLYKDLNLTVTLQHEVLSIAAAMADRNLNFTLAGNYDRHEETPRYQLTLDIKNADFHALHLSQSALRGRGMLKVNLATDNFRQMNGNVGIRKVAIFNGDELYAVDSLLFASIDQEGYSHININSDLLSADFEGSINIFALPGVIRQYIDSYYGLEASEKVADAGRQHFNFRIRLKNTDLLTGLLVPKLTSFVPGEINGEFDSERKNLDIHIGIDSLQYSNISITSFVFSTHSDSTELNYNIMADRIMVDSMRVDGLEFNGTVANDSIRTNLVVLDSAGADKYVLAGTLIRRDKGFALKFDPQTTLLNYQTWTVPEDNIMLFGGQKFVAKNVTFANGREKIIIESDEQPGSPIHIGFRQLNLEYLASIIAEKKPLSGLLEGDLNIHPDPEGMAFTSDITIDNLAVAQTLWGDLSLEVGQNVRNRYDIDFALSGNGNDLTIKGHYINAESPAMDMKADIRNLNLESLQPVVANQLKNLTGDVAGTIMVRGTPDRPDIDGGITFSDTRFLSTYLNTSFSLDKQKITFVDEGISFDEFEIADNNNNKARIDGTILTRTYRDFRFNLRLASNDFRLLNTTEKDNDLFFGRVAIALNATIQGDMTTPVINMQVGLTKGSNLTYVVPQSDASILQSEGIVTFVDKTFEKDPFMKNVEGEASDTVKSTFRGIDLTAMISLTHQETFTIVIDPLTQDQLTVKGNATMTFQIDPTGDIGLTGRYEISEGTYNLSFYKFVKREFAIEKGSTITWLGDPLNGQMDIRAIYKVETSPIELFSNQLNGAANTEVNRYKQRLPFLVYLDLTGYLLQPEISFELAMPPPSRNALGGAVYARLQDINTRESDLNKQVFALLILKRFIADDPFENQGPGGFESTARRSVSKILSEQLNRLSQNIKGVELSFDIKSYEDYSSGQSEGQTELQLGLSKSLFNDRLVVKLSGNIDVEGENSNRQATDYIGDLALEYKLTPDGRLRITGFRNSDYDMIDGELIETGAGVIYVKDYNTLSELFKANAETSN